MVIKGWKCPRSLLSRAAECVVDNLPLYASQNFEVLSFLPPYIKNRILKRFTTSSCFWKNVDFNAVLSALLNETTHHVNLTSTDLTDEILEILSKNKNIRKLYLSRCSGNNITTNALIKMLQPLEQLTFFILTNCDKVNDDVLKCIADNCPNLVALDIGGSENVTDVGIEYLVKLKNLTWLTLSRTKITDKGITSLVAGYSGEKIKELRIDNCENISELGMRAIAEHCPNIEVLIFYNCSSDRDQALSTFNEANFKNLKQLIWTITW